MKERVFNPIFEKNDAKEHRFSFLPNHDLLFLDNSCIFFSRYHGFETPADLERGIERTRILTGALRDRNNWLTIPQVIGEFKEGMRGFRKLSKRLKSGNRKGDYKNLVGAGRKLLKLLRQEHVNAISNMTDEALERKAEIADLARRIPVQDLRGELSKTDIELVATTLAYGYDCPVHLFSFDYDLLKVYCECSISLKMPFTPFYISETLQRSVIAEHGFKGV
jgi:rRNA maturation endonuclease Nob1